VRELSLNDAAFCHFSVEILWKSESALKLKAEGIFFISFVYFHLAAE